MNFHSCAPRRVGEPTDALVACVTGENPRSVRLECDGFAAGRGAGVVHLLASRDRSKARNEGMRGVLNDECACGVAGKVFGYRVSAIGYRVKADSGTKRSLVGIDPCIAEMREQPNLVPAGRL